MPHLNQCPCLFIRDNTVMVIMFLIDLFLTVLKCMKNPGALNPMDNVLVLTLRRTLRNG